jgi:folate-binding protein YgfZ
MTEATYCRLSDRGLLRIAGADARAFLHGQVTQAINDLPGNQTRLAAWLNPKGRVLALFDVVPEADAFCLMLPADLANDIAVRLRRFVLRAAVEIEPVTDRVVFALLGDGVAWLAARGIELNRRGIVTDAETIWVDVGPGRVDVIGKATATRQLFGGLKEVERDAANRAAIAQGRPEVPAALSERYIPQMLNLDQLDAVSFTKGCYPGQEIVARTTNLGTVKRRIRRFATSGGDRPAPGDVIVDSGGQTAGEINRAASANDGFECLAVVQLDADDQSLTLQSDGRRLKPRPLPQTN